MSALNLEGHCKPSGAKQSMPIGMIHRNVPEETHLRLEEAELKLQDSHEPELLIDIDMDALDLETSKECGGLSDCQLRVYLNPRDNRGHFHLVGHRAKDGSLIYSNAVLVDQLLD